MAEVVQASFPEKQAPAGPWIYARASLMAGNNPEVDAVGGRDVDPKCGAHRGLRKSAPCGAPGDGTSYTFRQRGRVPSPDRAGKAGDNIDAVVA